MLMEVAGVLKRQSGAGPWQMATAWGTSQWPAPRRKGPRTRSPAKAPAMEFLRVEKSGTPAGPRSAQELPRQTAWANRPARSLKPAALACASENQNFGRLDRPDRTKTH